MSAQTCAVPACDAKTLRTYCIRCEINGPAREHAEALAREAAQPELTEEAA